MNMQAIKDRLAAYDTATPYNVMDYPARGKFLRARHEVRIHATEDIPALVKRVEELEAAIQKVLAIRKSSTQPESTKLDEEWVDGYNDILAKIQLYLKIVVKKNSVC